jgi:hypothetical protein
MTLPEQSMQHGSYFIFFFRRHTIVSASRPLPGLMSPRCSIALMVLRLAERGRISSSSFNRRSTGLPPSESVSSWNPSWMCESRSCSVSVSFGRRLAAFFFVASHVHSQRGLVHLAHLNHWRLHSATDAIPLPKPKPRAMREHFVVSSIRSRDVACAEWPNIRRFEHFL